MASERVASEEIFLIGAPQLFSVYALVANGHISLNFRRICVYHLLNASLTVQFELTHVVIALTRGSFVPAKSPS